MKKIKLSIIAIISLLPLLLSAQTSKQDSIWSPFKYFVGNWDGAGVVEGDGGKYERSYQFIFNRKFIEVKNKSTFQPTGNKPKGEVHEDLGYISYDKGRKIFVLRQFHIEGFVNQYKLDSISPDRKTIVFVSENIENIAPGWRAKESYRLVNENEFVETFELAEPKGTFEVYSKAKMTRK
ncbi:MAG TPA: hypothetical protein VGK38_09985 [Prolixibacteraceae bacterium]|jgi:hypothetical protein